MDALPPSQLFSERRAYAFEFQTYEISNQERIHLFGARQKRYVTDSFYWGEAGYGALFGERAGYIEGGVVAGFEAPPPGPFFWDLRLFIGAGGGGSAPQGGGFIVHPSGGLGARFNDKWSASLDAGYAHFMNGNISSVSWAVNLNYAFRALRAREPREP